MKQAPEPSEDKGLAEGRDPGRAHGKDLEMSPRSPSSLLQQRKSRPATAGLWTSEHLWVLAPSRAILLLYNYCSLPTMVWSKEGGQACPPGLCGLHSLLDYGLIQAMKRRKVYLDCLSRLWFPHGCRSLRKLLRFHLSQEAGVNAGAQSGTPNP